MVRHAILKQRIDKEACKLKEFSARQLCDILNNYTNCNGTNRTRLQITMGRLINFLQANKKITFVYHPAYTRTRESNTGTWKWIGDKE